MPHIVRAACALLLAFPVVCAANPKGDPITVDRLAVTRAERSWPSLTAARHDADYSDQGHAGSGPPVLAAAAGDGQTAPLLPLTWIDVGETWIEAIAAGDLTGDLRSDVVAFGPRPSPDHQERQITLYLQSVDGALGVPLHSPVTSRLTGRPGGLLVRPVLGARPDVVAWGSFWIEIYSVGTDGTVVPTPVTIAPGFAILDVDIRDLNSDGRPDFVVSGTDTNDVSMPTTVRRYIQTGVATFAPGSDAVMPFTPYGVDGILADIDGDAIIDVIDGVSGSDFGFLYRPGLGDGTFGAAIDVLETATDFTLVKRLFVRDLDVNGLPDVVLATHTAARVRFQTAPGVFTTVHAPYSGALINVSEVTTGDLDGNGLFDLVIWSDGHDLMHVALQATPQVFTAAGRYAVPSGGSYPSFYENTALFADANGDTKTDLLVVAAGLAAFYNSTGSYPVLDASVTSTAQADDSRSTAYVLWQHEIANAGPTALADSVLLQNIPAGYELSGTSLPCAYLVSLVACGLPPVPAGASTTVYIEAQSVRAREQDGGVHSTVVVSVGGQPIDTAPDNNGTEVTAFVRGHPENLQAAGDEVFVYEGAADAVVPVIGSPGTSSLHRCMNYTFQGNNAPDDTGIAGAINGHVCTAPGVRGEPRIRLGVRDGATVNTELKYGLAFSFGGFSAPGDQTLTIVDDDGSDPKLTAWGAQPFDEWPAAFSSISTVYARTGGDTASPRAITLGDLDGDGRNDLAISFSDGNHNPSSILVWLQQSDGLLSATPLKWSGSFSGAIASLAIGDVIGDSTPELVVPLYTELDVLRIVNGQLQLVSATLADGWKAAVSDLNGDGYADIVLADDAIQTFDGPEHWVPNVTVFRGNAQRTLDPAPLELAMPYAGRNEIVIGDFNDDDLGDIAVSSGQGNFPSASIAYQNDDGTFAFPVGVWVSGPMHLDGWAFGDSVTAADFNDDGKTDLAVGSYVGENLPSVWIYTDLRDDDFSYPSQRLYGGPEGSLGALDVDHDGREDLLVDNSVFPGFPGSPMKLFVQAPTEQLLYGGTLSLQGSGQHDQWIPKIEVGDLDGDGRDDAVIVNQHSGIVSLAHSAAANQTVQLTTLESSDQVAAGARARYRMRVTNNGERRSLEIPLSWFFPPQLTSAQIVAAKGGCYFAPVGARCLLPQLEPGGHVDVMLTGTFLASGTYAMSVAAGPDGTYGSRMLSAAVMPASNGGGTGSSGGTGGNGPGGGSAGGSAGGTGSSSGGGGALGWLGASALLAALLRRRRLRVVFHEAHRGLPSARRSRETRG